MTEITFPDFNTILQKIDEEYRKQGCAKGKLSLSEFRTCCIAWVRKQLGSGVKPDDLIIGKATTEEPILKVNNYLDNVKIFWGKHPFFYDKSKNFWFWNLEENKYEIIDEIDVMNLISKKLKLTGDTISAAIKQSYLEAFKRVGREKKPKDAPLKWIQFKDKAFSLKSKKIYQVKPNYFFTNPIPWELGIDDATPTLDKLFQEWVGKKYTQTLYELVAYCCYRSYPIHLAFCLIGNGRNGKTQFQKLLVKFLGADNVCSTELDAIVDARSRFETFKLYKRLIVVMGETNFGTLSRSSMFKKLTGGDMIGFEQKNKTPFDAYSYAKLIINSNSLPISKDSSEGFYRRWLIIDFPNTFPEGKDIIDQVPDEEFSNLARKIINILPKLLEKGKFTNQGTINERQAKYIFASNPLPFFIQHFFYENPNGFIRFSKFYSLYTRFLTFNNKRVISKKEFSKLLGFEGLESRRTSKEGEVDYYIEGIKLKENLLDLPDLPDVCISFLHGKVNTNSLKSGKSSKNGNTTPENLKNKVLAFLKKRAFITREGIQKELNLNKMNEIEKILDFLKKNGEIYEPEVDKIKKLE